MCPRGRPRGQGRPRGLHLWHLQSSCERSIRVVLFGGTGGLGNCRNLLISGDMGSWQAHSQEFARGG